MAEDVLVFNSKNTAADAVQSFYTAIISGSGVRINAFKIGRAHV